MRLNRHGIPILDPPHQTVSSDASREERLTENHAKWNAIVAAQAIRATIQRRSTRTQQRSK